MLSLPTRERGLKPSSRQVRQRSQWSLPTRERGLKLDGRNRYRVHVEVAPHAGAWIETVSRVVRTPRRTASLPTRERGLKLSDQRPRNKGKASLPTRERGLKPPADAAEGSGARVAPHAGAWIETRANA